MTCKYLTLVLVFITSISQAQTFSEWFKQKKTQIKYLHQQIAALEVYARVAREGYRIAEEGTDLISALKRGDLDLHRTHFTALTKVNPHIAVPALNQDLKDTRSRIEGVLDQISAMADGLPRWSELLHAYCQGIREQCAKDLEQFRRLTTDGGFALSDEERITAIDRIREDQTRCYHSVIKARNDVAIIYQNRKS